MWESSPWLSTEQVSVGGVPCCLLIPAQADYFGVKKTSSHKRI